MQQAKFSLSDEQVDFLNQFQALGYPDKSALVRAALDRLKKDVTQEELRQSAELYAEVYAEEEDLQQLTDQAIEGWPE